MIEPPTLPGFRFSDPEEIVTEDHIRDSVGCPFCGIVERNRGDKSMTFECRSYFQLGTPANLCWSDYCMNRVVKIADDLRRRLSAANEVIEFHKARVVNRDHQIAELSKLTPEPVPASTTPRIEPGLYSECMWTP